ncbi:MAG TPA: antibiotic biosynthesis monooxygenase family protein [Aldersonia sp.]
MVWEIAKIEIDPSNSEAFENALREAVPLFRRAPGCRAMQVRHSLKHPHRYFLVVDWDTVDDHLVGFRNSPDFARWRELVGGFFARPPEVEHAARLDLG